MKKVIFALAAVVALAACSKEQTIVADRGDAIGFDSFIENATRVTGKEFTTVDSFQVWGTVKGNAMDSPMSLYNGALVERNNVEDGAAFTCRSQTEYWIPSATYNFVALAGHNRVTLANDMPETISYTADGETDLIYTTDGETVKTNPQSVPEEGVNGNGCVAFTFNHLLSKVHFTVTSTAQGDYYHTVTGIKVANYSSGTYAITTDTWTGKTAKDVPFADIAEVTNTAGKSNADMLLVPTAATFNVMFTVNLYKDNLYKDDTLLSTENKTVPVTIKDAQDNVVGLQKGNSYNFTIACSVGNPIKFGVTNDPSWGDTTNVTIQ
jgi:hypothetical protein